RWGTPRRADLASGATTAVIDWEHANLQRAADVRGVREWEVVVPSPRVGGLVCQAVNQEAPHPAAARLWVEFVLSDEGQNLQFRNASYPVRFAAMHQDGTVDTGERAAGAAEPPLLLTPQQVAQARDTLRAYGIGPGDECLRRRCVPGTAAGVVRRRCGAASARPHPSRGRASP